MTDEYTRWRVGWRNTVRSKFGFMLSLDEEDLRITRFLQKSLHTNPFRKIPDYNWRQFMIFKEYFTKSVGPGRFSAEK